PVAVQNMGGGNAQAKDFGDAKNLIAAFLTILIIVAIEVWTKGFLRSISVLIGLIAGTVIASFMGLVSLKPVMQASWFHLPQLFYFGVPEFEWSSCLTMIIIALVSMVESTGVFFAIGDLL
ncbi:solute carrier family 23 protein, partial [Lactobacillus amylovorus]